MMAPPDVRHTQGTPGTQGGQQGAGRWPRSAAPRMGSVPSDARPHPGPQGPEVPSPQELLSAPGGWMSQEESPQGPGNRATAQTPEPWEPQEGIQVTLPPLLGTASPPGLLLGQGQPRCGSSGQGLPLSPPPLCSRMAPSPNASACLHSPNEKQLCLWKRAILVPRLLPTHRRTGCCSLGELRGAREPSPPTGEGAQGSHQRRGQGTPDATLFPPTKAPGKGPECEPNPETRR